ncbi:hypothetical protein ES705_45326 [subsurface metagenome]
MVVRAAASPVLTTAEVFIEGGIFRFFNHFPEPFLHSLQSIIGFIHDEKCFHDVFLHIGTGQEAVLEYFQKGRILLFICQSGYNGQGLCPVIILTLIVGCPVSFPVPENSIKGFFESFHFLLSTGKFRIFTQ